MKFNERNILLVAVTSLSVIIIIFLVILVSFSRTEHVIVDQNTGLLNCAGVWEDGDYLPAGFLLKKPVTIRVTALGHNLPPSNFDIYIMTESQYNTYKSIWSTNGNLSNAPYLHKWDLTHHYNNNMEAYYLDTNYPLAAGTYYLVVANNYYQFGRGVYGSGSLKVGAYFSVSSLLEMLFK